MLRHLRDLPGPGMSREHVQIGHNEEAIEFVLESQPIPQAPYIVSQVQLAGRSVASQDPLSFHSTPPAKPAIIEKERPSSVEDERSTFPRRHPRCHLSWSGDVHKKTAGDGG
jgi:hypothetical protein